MRGTVWSPYKNMQIQYVKSYLVLSSVSPFFNATADGASLALANSTKCAALSALKKPGNKYVLRGSMRLT